MTGGRVRPGPGAAERARQQLEARIGTPVAGCQRIAVVALKGGVGKTTTTACLGAIFAEHRGDRVVAVDANPDPGTLGYRIRRDTTRTAKDLLDNVDKLERYADVRAYASQTDLRLEVIASEADPARDEAFGEEDYRELAAVLERFYSLVLTDCGPGLLHSAMRAILPTADQLVVVAAPSLTAPARPASPSTGWTATTTAGWPGPRWWSSTPSANAAWSTWTSSRNTSPAAAGRWSASPSTATSRPAPRSSSTSSPPPPAAPTSSSPPPSPTASPSPQGQRPDLAGCYHPRYADLRVRLHRVRRPHRGGAVDRGCALTTCTVCGGRLRKVFSPVGIVFKGSGFYRTDSRGKSAKADGDKAKKPADAKASSSSSDSKTSDGGSSTSKPKAAEKSA